MRNTNTNKWIKPALAAATALLATACASNPPSAADDPMAEQKADLVAVDTTRDTGIRDAVVEQHALYPYHFETGSARLNSLGLRDLGILADNFHANGGGEISLGRGDASDTLYAARTEAIKSQLTTWGLAADSVKIGNGLPGGEGAVSNDVNQILKNDAKVRDSGGSGASGGASGGGSASPGGAAAATTGGM